jgi:uncharacterized protein (DUF927 family)
MVTESNIRYIVVLFYQGIGYTLQTDNKPHVFFEGLLRSLRPSDVQSRQLIKSAWNIVMIQPAYSRSDPMKDFLVIHIISGSRMRAGWL